MLFGQVMAGGIPTVMSTDAALPVPPFVEVTLLVVLVLGPDVLPAVTVTLKVQLPPAEIVAPVSVIRLLPVTVSVPPH
jgi:hypothetical protein